MSEAYPFWLDKEMLKGVRRFNIDAYLVALEGWRRGLSLTFYEHNTTQTDIKLIGFDPIGKLFSLSSEDKSHFFYRTRGDKISNEAVDIGTDKELAKKYLKKAGVPIPEGFGFTSDTSVEDVTESIFENKGSFVLKPTYGSLGKGVTTNIQTKEFFKESLEYIKTTFDYTDFIAEQHIEGEDIRVYVVGDKIAAATKRTSANVTGDGTSSIEELISFKNESRKSNPHTVTRLIKIDDRMKAYLNKQNLELSHIPDKGETVYLKGESNISAGGDSIDVTDSIRQEVRDIAVAAVKAIPDLHHAGVDMIVSAEDAVVIEINSTGSTALHTFPFFGESQNVAEKIIDYYFPETKNQTRSDMLYFDYRIILKQLRSNSIKQIEVTDALVGKIYAKRYIISGKVQKVGYRIWAENNAIREGLHGYARNLKNGDVEVVVAGLDIYKVDNFKHLCYGGPERAKVENVIEYSWDNRVKIGFEIKT